MRLFFLLGLRNLARNPRRTFTTGVTLAVGVLSIIFLRGLIDGIEGDLSGLIIRTQSANIQFHARGFRDAREDEPLKFRIRNCERLVNALQSVPGVVAVAERFVFPGQVGDGRDLLPCRVCGIVPEREFRVFSRMALDGRIFRDGDDESAMISSGLAKIFSLKPGSTITIVGRTVDGALSALDLDVCAVFSTGNPVVDQQTVLLPLATAREIVDISGDEVNEISVRTRRDVPAYPAVTRTAGKVCGNTVEWRTWFEATGDIRKINLVRRKAFGVTLLFLGLIVALGVSNTILMATYERSREIGTMGAMGFSRAQIMTLFILEAFILGLLAGCVGAAAGGSLNSWLGDVGIPLPAAHRDQAIPIPERIYVRYATGDVLQALLFGVLLAAGSAVYPAWRATLVEPAGALRRV